MPEQKAYSDRQRAEAMALLVVNGGNISATAKALQIPRRTLREWRAAAGPAARRAADDAEPLQGELAEKFKQTAERMVTIAHSKPPDEISARDAMVSAGIATEKFLLLNGQPTSIHGSASGPLAKLSVEQIDMLLKMLTAPQLTALPALDGAGEGTGPFVPTEIPAE